MNSSEKCLASLYSLLLTFMLGGLAVPLSAQPVAPFTEEQVGDDWSNPVQIFFESNGRGYVVERHGLVWIIDENGNKLGEPLIDIREETVVFGDHGLLSVTLHPDFRSNGYIYLLYTVDRHHLLHFGTEEYDPSITITDHATIGRLTRYTADPATDFTSLIEGSRTVIIGDRPSNGFPILMPSHGIGTVAFGSDGTLLISCGDAGSFLSYDFGSAPETYFEQALEDDIIRPKENIGSYRSQLVDCMNGKILRIDPETGLGLPSNPFYEPRDPGSARSKVWALGFRQPYRFVVKPGTGSHYPEDGNPGVLYVGDVGTGFFEELNVVTEGGQNFGWPLYEGFDPQSNYRPAGLLNPDAPNLLFKSGCDQQFFRFVDLVAQPNRIEQPVLQNPCAETESIPDAFSFVHAVPSLVWSNEKYNPPTRAVVADWHTDGALRPVTLGDPDAPVQGFNFEGSSSIPGFFYDAQSFPEELRGKYFHADFTGWIHVMDFNEEEQLVSIDSFHNSTRWIVDMAVNPVNGALYHVNMNNKVFRIKYGGNRSPVPVIQADRTFGPSPLAVHFRASESYDPDGHPITFKWDFPDGTSSDDPEPSFIFNADNNIPTQYVVRLTVTDSLGDSKEDQIVISINNTPPVARITSVKDGDLYTVTGTNFTPLRADISDAEFANSELFIQWQTFLHHNEHYHPEFPVEGEEATAVLSPAGCNGETFYYRINLTVTDPAGLSATDEVLLYPYCGADIVDFIAVNAAVDGQSVNLHWEVIAHGTLDRFEIHRAVDYGDFEPIGQVNGDVFSFIDQRPVRGELTYRISALREDGVYQYSNEVSVEYPLPDPYNLYPNPAVDNITLSMPATTSDVLKFELYTTEGRLVGEYNFFNSISRDPLERVIPLSGVVAGVYFYKLTDGELTYHGSILVTDNY